MLGDLPKNSDGQQASNLFGGFARFVDLLGGSDVDLR